ncbi:ArsR family transcriptional regulator [Cryobacterium algoritolerans]|uniref:ArsR family transcriptional regulator n=1 Tax=Cryobacterium algoritolerans TaxID=1259184 RepID=A0A4R8WWD9_9MICO|nr:ArsR family transcriptional regulator [Cryobacterium algoritolerans]
MLTMASRLDVADPTRSRILLSLLDQPGYLAKLPRDLELARSNVSNHLSCRRGCGVVAAVPEARSTAISALLSVGVNR